MRIDNVKVMIDYAKLLDILREDSKLAFHKMRMWIAWFIAVIVIGNLALYVLLPPELAILFVIVWVLILVASVGIFIYTMKSIPRYLYYLPFQQMLAAMEYATEVHNAASFKVLDEMPYIDTLFDSWECLRIIEQGINDLLFDVAHSTLNVVDSAGITHTFYVSEFYTEDSVDTWLHQTYVLVITLDNLYVVNAKLIQKAVPITVMHEADQIQ